jgi:hypothetical protein
VDHWLIRQFSGRWIGRRGPVEWPPTSPGLISRDIYLRGHLKATVYRVKIQNTGHLKESIRDACARVTPDVLKCVRHKWKRRISKCCQCNGAHRASFVEKETIFLMFGDFSIALYINLKYCSSSIQSAFN